MISGRREFILGTTRTTGLLVLSGLIWSAYVDEITANKLILRPPAALKEEDFLSTCIKCGMCVEACPFNTLVLAKPGSNKPLGTPYFEPRQIPCYMCPDIPCVPVCPTGALDATSVSTNKKLDINKSKMGVAIVDDKNCIAFWGIQCDACYRACPLMDEAIYLKYEKNERTGKHAFLKPIVNSDICTGCGLCEHACVTKEAAIIVLPRKVALGEVGNHYIKGWDKKDEIRIKKSKNQTTKTKISEKSALDSLNETKDLY
ncbi:Ferredoxin-type protein NapG (periplasmic nitrate reductase) [hydrothermal vent metagenome]|uniref:Ferredoxin-type protein NapG (Periplasmic nitrate reductase) n=1 Tax=hydrothermal vent metagenome TaxID=652676 RepID=A0A3B1EA04_9ZZZZ